MGLFDKALKDMLNKAGETIAKAQESEEFDSAMKEAKNLFGNAKDALGSLAKKGEEVLGQSDKPAENASYVPYEFSDKPSFFQGSDEPSGFTWGPVNSDEPSGFSWGPEMPDEPNQFNYGGPWQAYFAAVFAECFPDYTVMRTDTERGAIYTFTAGGRKALCAEVMDEGSEANSFRKKCRAEGTPYVRFYYNHAGWWNTKEYVYVRVREALER